MNANPPREQLERAMRLAQEMRRRKQRALHASRGWIDENGVLQGGLMQFMRDHWHVLEPDTPMVEGWALYAIVQHLEAVTFGEVRRLLMNVSPGSSKSLTTCVFWPAWEWGPMKKRSHRFVTFSYSASLTERDNERFRDLICSPEYRSLYPDVTPQKIGAREVSNTSRGWKRASSVTGSTTGWRGHRVILDDPHNVKEVESEDVRDATIRWFRESMSSRLNDIKTSAIVIIMQRVHEGDVSGVILSEGFDYVHLCIPMQYEWQRHCRTEIGWEDPRGLDDDGNSLLVIDEETGLRSPRDDAAAVLLEEERDGELAWPERFPPEYLPQMMAEIGPYAVAGQLQQAPTPRGGGIFQRAWWQPWETDSYPEFSFILASLDTAFTEKEQNDPSALTVWGVFDGPDGMPKTMLIDAWRKRLEMHGSLPLQMFGEKDVRGQPNREYLLRCEAILPRQPRETDLAYYVRVKDAWGLVEWVAYTCRRMRVNRLIIENKTGGITAAQELQRIHGMEGYGIELHTPHGDKVARALAVQPIFSQGMVFAPPYEFAETVIQEMENFPRGRYKDLTDSSTQAVKWLRDNGFADRPEELRFQEDQRRQLRRASKPLYGVR